MVAVLALALTGCTEPVTTGFISDDKNPWLKKAEEQKQRRAYTEAAESYEQALKLNPDSAAMHWAVALIDEQQNNDLASSIYHYQRFLKLNTDQERAKTANVFIERAKRNLIASMPNTPMENASEMTDLLQKNRALQDDVDKLRQQLAEAQMRLANLPQAVASAQPPPLEPNIPPASNAMTASSTPTAPPFGAQPQQTSQPPPAQPATTGAKTAATTTTTQPPATETQTPAVNPKKTTTYKVKSGDTLAVIALKYYGDRNLWPQIYKANHSAIPDKDRLLPGTVLTIPPRKTR